MRLWLALVSITALCLAPLALRADDTAKPAADDPAFVLMKTSKGDVVLELNRAKAPVTVENFLKYADDKFYDGTIFHRVIKGMIIQGGGHTADMKRKNTRPPIANEWQNGLKNARGTISMARLPQPDSATSQFFINLRDNASLDGANGDAGYAVFGHVVAGMKVIEAIGDTQTGMKGGMRDVPNDTITIDSVARLSAEDAKKRIEAEGKAK